MSSKSLKNLKKNTIMAVTAMTFTLSSHWVLGAPVQVAQEQLDGTPGAASAGQKPHNAAPAGKDESAASFSNYLAGRFAESQGDTPHGIEYLKDSLKRDPDNKDMLKSLYRMEVFSGALDDAVVLAKKLTGTKVVDDGSEFQPEMLLALSAAKSGDYALADKHLSAVSKAGFNSLMVPLMRAWLKLGMNEIKAPLDVKSLTSDGHVVLPHIYLNAALINDIKGYDAQAEKQYEEALKDPRIEPFRAVEALADFYARKGMKDKRDKLVKDYLSTHGDSYLADELLAKPAGQADKMLVTTPTQGLAEVIYTVANIFHGIRSPAEEIASVHLALYMRPDFPAAQFLLANAFELSQDYNSAAKEYETINPSSPYYTRGRIRMVYDEIELGHKDTALAALDRITRENPEDIEALLAKADILRLENKYKEAIETYDTALARVKTPEKRHWVIYFSRGACYQLEGDWSKSEADMKKALALDPDEPEVLNYLGYSWLTMRQHIPEAKKMIEEAYNARPEEAHIIDSMGYALYVTGDFTGAQEYFRQALERTPDDPSVNDHMGDTYWQLGRKTDARFAWQRALTGHPDEETEKGLHKKLKDGLAMMTAKPYASQKPSSSPAPVTE